MVDFYCDKCGLCCQHIGESIIAKDMDDGNGICIYYDKETRLCKTYNSRPLICNVKEGYSLFADKMSYEEYLEMNYKVCLELKRRYL